jgi:hypothetical protein
MTTATPTIYLSMIAVILAHEAGHVLAAVLCGVPLRGFVFGMGPIVRQWSGHGLILRWRLLPVAVCVATERSRFAWQGRVIALAGPATGLVLVALAIVLVRLQLAPASWAALLLMLAVFVNAPQLLPVPGADGWRALVSKGRKASHVDR